MTKKQIKEALRKEANRPHPMFVMLPEDAAEVASSYLPIDRAFSWQDRSQHKQFFLLLVAEAL